MSRPSTLRAVVVVTIVYFMAVHTEVRAALLSFDISQVNFELGADSVANSDWGHVSFSYDAAPGIQYFNLTMNNRWAAINVPVLSNVGIDVGRQRGVSFSLGNAVGTDVTSGVFRATLTPAPLSAAPSGGSTLPVTDTSVTVGSLEESPGPPGPAPTLDFTNFAAPGRPSRSTSIDGARNQNCGVDECAPAAFSNSIWYLNDKFHLNIPPNKFNIPAMKTATHWRAPTVQNGQPVPGTGGTSGDWVGGKREAVSQWIKTTEVSTLDAGFMDTVYDALAEGCDVEIRATGHIAVVTGLSEGADGSWAIDVGHDVLQGQSGGVEVETIKYNPSEDRLANGGYGFNLKLVRSFIIECPVPEPASISMIGLIGAWSLKRPRRARLSGSSLSSGRRG
jgi:hypothetical protein